MMVTFDYGRVASRYDNNPIRNDIPIDPVVARLRGDQPSVLDLACGTGTYLKAQCEHYRQQRISWYGVDASTSMLAVARPKVPAAKFVHGLAEALPFADQTFDYVVSRFAFHHFGKKERSLEEVYRVLRDGGFFRIQNMTPELSPDWWIYRYFPEAKAVDRDRFWTLARLTGALRGLGFRVEAESKRVEPLPLSALHTEARNRETSHLMMISDRAYRDGFERISEDLRRSPRGLVDPGLVISSILSVK